MDIQVGDRVTYKSGESERQVIMTNEEQIENYRRSNLILKIERPKYEVIEENEELLTKEEKEFLKLFIKFANYRPRKIKVNGKQLELYIDNRNVVRSSYEFFNCFEKLEPNKFYTLNQLGV